MRAYPTLQCLASRGAFSLACADAKVGEFGRVDGFSREKWRADTVAFAAGRRARFFGKAELERDAPAERRRTKAVQRMFDEYVEGNANATLAKIGEGNLDAALVDGRFRVACALRLLPYLRRGAVIFIHDFWNRLDSFYPVLDFYRVRGAARNLVALERRPVDRLPDGWRDAWRRARWDRLGED